MNDLVKRLSLHSNFSLQLLGHIVYALLKVEQQDQFATTTRIRLKARTSTRHHCPHVDLVRFDPDTSWHAAAKPR